MSLNLAHQSILTSFKIKLIITDVKIMGEKHDQIVNLLKVRTEI